MNTLLGELATLNDIQYPRYRIAFKLRKLQKDFLLDHLDVGTLQEALHLSGVGALSRGAVVPLPQLHSSISELYSCLRVLRPMLGSTHQIKQAQELSYNWLQMNYQCSAGGKIEAGSLKATLCLLSGAKQADKSRYLFSILAGSNGAVGSCDLGYFCTVTQQLAGTLHEHLYSEWEESNSLWLHCLRFVRSAEDIDDDEYDGGNIKRQWLSQFEFTKLFTSQPEPKFLTWLTLYHSLSSIEKVAHPVRCAVCTRKPMVSFRYQCTQCNNFNLCQMCFLKGRVLAGKHADTHTMMEFGSASKQSWHHRLIGGANGRVRGGRVWDEPKASFVYNGRSSVNRCDSPMTSIHDMLSNSQQHLPNSVEDDHTHRPTMIRVGSQDSLSSKTQKQTPPLTEKRGGAGTPSSSNGSLNSISSNGGGEGKLHMSPVHRVKVSHSDEPRDKSHSMQHEHAQIKKEEDLTEINKRLSLELDMLLNDLPAPDPTTTTNTAVKSYKIPISNASPHVGGATKHLLKEGHNLEGQVSDLTDRRGQLAGELEGLISQVQGMHARSLSLTRGIRIPSPSGGNSPPPHPSPLVGPSHSRADSLPAEAYLMSSPSHSPQTYSPLITRKQQHEPSSSAHQMTGSNLAIHNPDHMTNYHKSHDPTPPQPQAAW